MASSNVKIRVLFLLCTLYLLIISFNTETRVSANAVDEDDQELERQLKKLNKPAKKSFKTEDGSIFDCVSITNQPALDHPLLKDHKIQMKPSSFATKKSSSFAHLFGEECPVGTVPIRRTSKEHLVRARSLLDDSTLTRQASVGITRRPSFRMFGAGANISVQSLDLSSDQYSSSSIVIQSGPSDVFNLIVAGWMVSPELFGDSRTRIFTYWTGDGNQKTGCYNTLCSGFVQVDTRIAPSSLITPTSIYGGTPYVAEFLIYQDKKTGNWWLMWGGSTGVSIGYWPKNLFPYLEDGARDATWRGNTIASISGISPPMGNGHFPNGDIRYSSSFSSVYYVNEVNTMVRLSNAENSYLFQQIDKPKCYGLKASLPTFLNLGFSFTYGGPGGNNCD